MAQLALVEMAGSGIGDFAAYMTQCAGRGAISPKSTRVVCVGDSVSKSVVKGADWIVSSVAPGFTFSNEGGPKLEESAGVTP